MSMAQIQVRMVGNVRDGPSFFRLYFPTSFFEWKLTYFFFEYDSVGSGYALAPDRQHAIICTNDALVYMHLFVIR